jgi:hypothetical protein
MPSPFFHRLLIQAWELLNTPLWRRPGTERQNIRRRDSVPDFNDSELETRPPGPISRQVLAKIDWIEAQMVLQWWAVTRRIRLTRARALKQIRGLEHEPWENNSGSPAPGPNTPPNPDRE